MVQTRSVTRSRRSYSLRRPGLWSAASSVGPAVGRAITGAIGRRVAENALRNVVQTPRGRRARARIQRRASSRGIPKLWSTGYVGKFKRKPKKVKFTKVRQSGTQSMIESGGVITSDNALYVGHSVPGVALLKEVTRAIIKKLFQKLGHRVLSMQDKVQDDSTTYIVSPGRIRFAYRRSAGDPLQTIDTTLVADVTYDGAAQAVYANFITVMNTPSTRPELFFDEIMYFEHDSTGNVTRTPMAKLFLSALRVDIVVNSKLHLQNRTIAGVSGTTDQSNMLDVANNPLDGKIYAGTGSNAQLKFADNFSSLSDIFASNTENGLCTVVPASGSNYTDGMMSVYKRPPSSYAFKFVTKATTCRLDPGQIKSSFVKFTKRMSFARLMHDMYMYMYQVGLGNAPRHPIGNFKMFGFEKRCNTTVDEPQISVGYEVNATLTVGVFEKPSVTLRDVRNI